jgi:hypothetical protein
MANFVDVHRQRVTTPGAPRWPLRWLPNWLWPARGHVPGTRPGSAAAGKRVVLRDGSAVLIRQVRPSDAPLLADGFARLSERARAAGIRRFTALVAEGSAAMAGVLRKLRADRVGRGGGTVDYEITLA